MPRSAWDVILERKTPRHIHRCPECYEHITCLLDCTIEPDLEREDGMPSGSYVCCSRLCAAGGNHYLADAYTPASEASTLQSTKEQLPFDFTDPK